MADNTLLAAYFGIGGSILGAIIGGVASYKGSKIAAENSINAQRELYKEQKDLEESKEKEELKKLVQTSASIIYIDFFTALREVLRISTEGRVLLAGSVFIPRNFPLNTNYSTLIANLNSQMEFKELVLLNRLFGLIEKLKEDILNTTSRIKTGADPYEESAIFIGSEVFGNSERFFNVCIQVDYRVLYFEDNIIQFMDNEYKTIFKKLYKLIYNKSM